MSFMGVGRRSHLAIFLLIKRFCHFQVRFAYSVALTYRKTANNKVSLKNQGKADVIHGRSL